MLEGYHWQRESEAFYVIPKDDKDSITKRVHKAIPLSAGDARYLKQIPWVPSKVDRDWYTVLQEKKDERYRNYAKPEDFRKYFIPYTPASGPYAVESPKKPKLSDRPGKISRTQKGRFRSKKEKS